MLNNTQREYFLIHFIILILRPIGPLCSAYTLSIIWRILREQQRPTLNLVQAWCVAETAFYLFFLGYRLYLQREAVHPPLRTKDERKALFDKVRGEIHDPEKFLMGWFKGASTNDIGREDLRRFLDWAFWEGRAAGEEDEELDEYVEKVERMMGKQFPPGKGKAEGLRLTIDPIEMDCRSLLWYSIIMLVDTLTHFRLMRYGMKYYRTPATSLAVFPPRPATMMGTGRSAADQLSYWLRPHTSNTRLPVVFIHGIGIGLHPNVEFLHELDQALNGNTSEKDDGDVGILSLELLQVSSRLCGSIPGRAELLGQLTQVLDAHGFKRFVLVSHSYGSVLSTQVLTHEPLASRVAATLFIDPVTILLHMPDVAYNFTARPPKQANEWQLWYFASKDPGVAHTLARHFFWSENLLWRDHIVELVQSGCRVTVSLASRDLIVDTDAVGMYLAEAEIPNPVVVTGDAGSKHMELQTRENEKGGTWKQKPWSGRGLEVLWWEGLDHAQVFDEKTTRASLIEVVEEYSKTR